MTSAIEKMELLSIREDSLLDYAPHKLRTLLKTPVPIDVERLNPRSPVLWDESLGVKLRSNSKSKTSQKKKPLPRHLDLHNHTRSQSLNRSLDDQEPDKYTSHRHRPNNHHRYSQPAVMDGCDIRFFIIRHGERVDRYFGPNWFMSAFDQFGHYRPYHSNFPGNLPSRSNKYYWAVDTPLTRDGLNAAQNVGRVLGLNQFEPNYVYASPAMRCVLTTYQILKGLGLENKLTIRIEPGLLELGAARFGMGTFLKPIDWRNYGVNVDLSYQPIVTEIPPVEREDAYYLRSKYVIRALEQRHSHAHSPLLNVLLVAHATSPETLTWDLVGRTPNVNDLYTLSLNIGYLQMVITERQRQNKSWALKQMPLQSTTLKWV